MQLAEVMLERTTRNYGQNDNEPENDSLPPQPHRAPLHSINVEANGTPESIYLWSQTAFDNDEDQQRAFQIQASMFVLTYIEEADRSEDPADFVGGTSRHEYNRCKSLLKKMAGKAGDDEQLIMFLSGPGGSGKSEVILEFLKYCEQYCANIEQPFTQRTVLVTARSGVAATLIHGQTLHAATFLNKSIKNIDPDMKLKFKNQVRMIIVDEVSMMAPSEFTALNKRLNWLMDQPAAKYGTLSISFMGDFRQLPPVGVEPIYHNRKAEFCDYVNCFIELKGQCRFEKDPEFGKLCQRFHIGCPTENDFKMINSRLVSPSNPLPKNVRSGCKYNSEREAINVATWIEHLKEHGSAQGLVILADNVKVRRKGEADKPLADKTAFYTSVGEDDCSTVMEGQFSPMVRCYPCCPLMMTKNLDVGRRLANGTQGDCTGVELHPGHTTHIRTINNMQVKCVHASQIKHLLWNVNDTVVEIKPKEFTSLEANFPIHESMSSNDKDKVSIPLTAVQIPLISNNACTGHKLQGSSVDNLCIPSWSYQTNWPYVLISRVRTLKGLHIGKKLDPTKDFSVPDKLNSMLRMFRRHKMPSEFDSRLLNLHT